VIAEEAEEFKAAGGRLDDGGGELAGAGSVAADEDAAGVNQAGGDSRRGGAKEKAKQQKAGEGKEEEKAQEWATEVKAEEELNEDDTDAGPEALLCGAGDDLNGWKSREAVVGAQPERDDDESKGGDQEEGEFSGGLKVEEAGKGQKGAGEVGRFEGSPDQNEVGEGKQGPRFAILAAEHG
jgi:hypothetical protein